MIFSFKPQTCIIEREGLNTWRQKKKTHSDGTLLCRPHYCPSAPDGRRLLVYACVYEGFCSSSSSSFFLSSCGWLFSILTDPLARRFGHLVLVLSLFFSEPAAYQCFVSLFSVESVTENICLRERSPERSIAIGLHGSLTWSPTWPCRVFVGIVTSNQPDV